jgi:hypothetical protein
VALPLRGREVARLHAAAHEQYNQAPTTIFLDLEWTSTRAVSDPYFTVQGTVATPDFDVILDARRACSRR